MSPLAIIALIIYIIGYIACFAFFRISKSYSIKTPFDYLKLSVMSLFWFIIVIVYIAEFK